MVNVPHVPITSVLNLVISFEIINETLANNFKFYYKIYKGYYSDQYKGRGSMYFLTLGTSEFCGIQYLAKIKISSQSNKTAGELVISFNNESVSLTSKDQELTANMEIKKLFIIKTDIKSGSSVSIKWNKKPKSFFQFTDPNAPNLVYDSIQLIHLSESET
jgi:hypothetical protein